MRVEDRDHFADARRRAIAADRSFVLNVVIARNVPLMPPLPAGAARLDAMRKAISAEPAGSSVGLL